MEQLTVLDYPIEPKKIQEIIKMLMSKKLIIPSFEYNLEQEIYDIEVYHNDIDFKQKVYWLMADRNLVTRWISLYRGKEVIHENDRLASAILSFAQLAKIDIDSGLAIQEAAKDNVKSNNELLDFYNANEVHPNYWSDVALGIEDKLPQKETINKRHTFITSFSFTNENERWQKIYILVLKIAELEFEKNSYIEKIKKLIKWMHKDYFINGTAVVLAINYFAPNSDRRGLLKKLRSPDRQKALEGIRNAAWDLTYLSEWSLKILEQDSKNEIWLFASLDKKLRDFARTILAFKEHENPLKDMMIEYLGEQDGNSIFTLLTKYRSSLNSSNRIINQPKKQLSLEEMIKIGEYKIINQEI